MEAKKMLPEQLFPLSEKKEGQICNSISKPEAVTGRTGTEGEQSSGFGLVLCKEFVEKMGGRIGVPEGKGSVFCFTVPPGEKFPYKNKKSDEK